VGQRGGGGALLGAVGLAQVLGGEVGQVVDDAGAGGTGQLLHVGGLDAADREDG
jgi:hypothetical protein